MREQLESLSVGIYTSYHQLLLLLMESGKISPRDIQVLKNMSRDFFKTINSLVQVFPEQESKNEEIKENKNNEPKTT